jgi:hypothetical protein
VACIESVLHGFTSSIGLHTEFGRGVKYSGWTGPLSCISMQWLGCGRWPSVRRPVSRSSRPRRGRRRSGARTTSAQRFSPSRRPPSHRRPTRQSQLPRSCPDLFIHPTTLRAPRVVAVDGKLTSWRRPATDESTPAAWVPRLAGAAAGTAADVRRCYGSG